MMNNNNISITSNDSRNISGNSTAQADTLSRNRNGFFNNNRNNYVTLEQLRNVEHWTRKQTLGSGNFGKITLWLNTQDSNSNMIAIKECKPFTSQNREYNIRQWIQEIEIMKRLECVNVVKGFSLPEGFKKLKVEMPLLAMEYCNGGDLRNILNKPHNCCGLEEKEVRQILPQISNAIQYLHQHDIVHRDIKPENILSHTDPVTRKTWYKLTDLGYAKELIGTTIANTFVGTWEYLAPELFQNQPQNSSVDNWSFGLLAFEIIVGRRPFFYDRTMDMVVKELKNKHSEHICLEVDLDTEHVRYSKVIPANTLISDSLKVHIENWLKIVLEYEPKKRGGNEAFQKIKDIINQPMIRIFKINTYKTLSISVNRNTTLEQIQEKVAKELAIPKEDQFYLLPNGKPVTEQFGKQIIETWFSSEASSGNYNPLLIGVVNYSEPLTYSELHFNIDLPPLVVEILCGKVLNHEMMKKAWKESIWTARDLFIKHTSLQQMFKSMVLTTVSLYNGLQTNKRSLVALSNEILASAYLLKQFTAIQIESISSQNDVSVLSSQTHMCKNNLEIINACMKVCTHETRDYLQSSNKIIPKFDKDDFLYDSLFREDCEPTLIKRYQELVKGYEKYRNNRHPDSSATEMILNTVTTMLMHTEKLFKGSIENIKKCFKFLNDIQNSEKECQQLTSRLNDIKTQVFQEHITCYKANNDHKATFTRQRSLLLDKNISNVRIVCETIQVKLATFKQEQFNLNPAELSLSTLELCDLFY